MVNFPRTEKNQKLVIKLALENAIKLLNKRGYKPDKADKSLLKIGINCGLNALSDLIEAHSGFQSFSA